MILCSIATHTHIHTASSTLNNASSYNNTIQILINFTTSPCALSPLLSSPLHSFFLFFLYFYSLHFLSKLLLTNGLIRFVCKNEVMKRNLCLICEFTNGMYAMKWLILYFTSFMLMVKFKHENTHSLHICNEFVSRRGFRVHTMMFKSVIKCGSQ